MDQSEIHGIYNRIRKSETIFMVLFVIRPTRRKMLEKGVQWVLQIRDDSFFWENGSNKGNSGIPLFAIFTPNKGTVKIPSREKALFDYDYNL